MTDAEQKRIKAICKAAHIDDISDLSDGYHTFRQLYYQRMMLFAALAKQNRDKAWKSLRHEDGELCFGGGWFIVGIDTPKGSYTYHYENKYFDLFDCEILDYAKHWDGHTEKDVIRLLSLEQEACEDCISRQAVLDMMQMRMGGKELYKAVYDLPPVTPQPKIGRWCESKGRDDIDHFYVCSECGRYIKLNCGAKLSDYPYCHCGAKMQEDENK